MSTGIPETQRPSRSKRLHHTIGTLTFGSDVAAGDVAEYVPDATYKKTEVNRTTPIEVAMPQCDAAVKVRIVLEIDEYLRKVDAYN